MHLFESEFAAKASVGAQETLVAKCQECQAARPTRAQQRSSFGHGLEFLQGPQGPPKVPMSPRAWAMPISVTNVPAASWLSGLAKMLQKDAGE